MTFLWITSSLWTVGGRLLQSTKAQKVPFEHSKDTKCTLRAQNKRFVRIQSTKRTLCSCLCSNHCTLYILALSGGQTVFFMMSPFHSGVTIFFSGTISFSWALPCFFKRHHVSLSSATIFSWDQLVFSEVTRFFIPSFFTMFFVYHHGAGEKFCTSSVAGGQ